MRAEKSHLYPHGSTCSDGQSLRAALRSLLPYCLGVKTLLLKHCENRGARCVVRAAVVCSLCFLTRGQWCWGRVQCGLMEVVLCRS